MLFVLYAHLSDGAVILIIGLTTLMKSKLTLFSMMLIGKTSGITDLFQSVQDCLRKVSAFMQRTELTYKR